MNRKVIFRTMTGGRRLEVTGQTAKALMALAAAGEHGCTALEVSSWALRFAHYVLCLRRLGLQIDMQREPHSGGWHGRYRLRSGVEIIETAEA